MTCATQIGSAPDWLKENSLAAQPIRLGSDTSSVWNFCARYSDVDLPGLKWRPRETSAVEEQEQANEEIIQLPVFVCGSRTSLFKLPVFFSFFF